MNPNTASAPTDDHLNPRQRGTLIEALGSAVFHGGSALGDVPALLKRVLTTGAWREFETPTHEVVTYTRFEAFVTTPPTRGLGADLALIRRIVADDLETISLLDEALQRPDGKPSHTFNNVQGLDVAPMGNSTDAAIRRLRKDRPDLHAQVLAGDLSPHRAMVEAGFRHPTITVP
ncbi:MAG TPA: hypothetical protein VE338_02260, partial [Ktedonobacterales bacterium]|nr:hypothetical protein [Ktedonobacterales bacterium]